MNLLWGYDTNAALMRELQYCFENATVVEEMLCSVLHMQVDVCFLRFGRGRRYQGLPLYRKNIIAFPQELAEVKQMLSFWTSLRPGDVVNVEFSVDDTFVVERCRVVGVLAAGFSVERAEGQRKEVKMEDVKQRVVLPWKPEDLRDNFIVLRRRNARKEDYVEDLRVRRQHRLLNRDKLAPRSVHRRPTDERRRLAAQRRGAQRRHARERRQDVSRGQRDPAGRDRRFQGRPRPGEVDAG